MITPYEHTRVYLQSTRALLLHQPSCFRLFIYLHCSRSLLCDVHGVAACTARVCCHCQGLDCLQWPCCSILRAGVGAPVQCPHGRTSKQHTVNCKGGLNWLLCGAICTLLSCRSIYRAAAELHGLGCEQVHAGAVC